MIMLELVDQQSIIMEFNTWKNNKNESPVDIFLEGLSGAHLAWIVKKSEYYASLSFPDMMSLGYIEKSRGDLWELKYKCPNTYFPVRMFYTPRRDNNLLLHAFPKKYDGAIRKKEIIQALNNFEILDNDVRNQRINNT